MKHSFAIAAIVIFACCACSTEPAAEETAASDTATRPLPEGEAKLIVENACEACHGLDFITDGPGHTPDDWRLLMDRMVQDGAGVAPEQFDMVTRYLADGFPERNVPPAVIIDGPVNVSFQEWTAPTKGSRPHDPWASRDGKYLWYSGQYASVLGRVDMTTGEITEFHPPVAGSGPHGLTEGPNGNIWFTANARGYIGKLDPETGAFTEYELPEGATDPHTPVFDQRGILWFTVQRSNKLGRLDPATGEIRIADSPTPNSLPYGMVVDSNGTPYYCEFGAPKIAAINPGTMEIREWTLPRPDSRPRRIAITEDNLIYYADFAGGYLGRLDPATGEVTEWQSPGGPRSQPYGITVVDGAVWYSESAVKPNTMVRFDPATESFQTWTIPGGGGVVRNMMTTADGNIVIAESAKNMVGLVEIAR